MAGQQTGTGADHAKVGGCLLLNINSKFLRRTISRPTSWINYKPDIVDTLPFGITRLHIILTEIQRHEIIGHDQRAVR